MRVLIEQHRIARFGVRANRHLIRHGAGHHVHRVFLAEQFGHFAFEAARPALPHLASDGQVVVLQNGLCEDRIAAIVGAERVIGGIVAWGAAMPEPGGAGVPTAQAGAWV